MNQDASTVDVDVHQDTCQSFENLNLCIKQFVKSICDKHGSCRKLSASFPKYYKKNAEIVQVVSDQLWEMFETKQLLSINQWIEEGNLQLLLCKLNKAKVDEDFDWKPTGVPDKDIEAHIANATQHELAKLTELYLKEKSEAIKLNAEIKEKETKVQKLLLAVTARQKEFEKVVDSCIGEKQNLSNAEATVMTWDQN
uniref:Polyamine-modulated factor 1-like n=1 Tax=Ciona intestinalis TaxID=7719 RepID=H2XLQ7_CIOIN|nr:polyamine-modulated factor 1-like [Ciona intestinalis]|eukprot:XP_002119229.1 polyamine-modulated factor 1-like [Ciona intestinalis]